MPTPTSNFKIRRIPVTPGPGFYVRYTTPPLPTCSIIELTGPLDFGDTIVNTVSTLTLTISNLGNASLDVYGIDYPVGFSGDWNGTVPSLSYYDVTVSFAPSAVQAYTGTVTVSSNKTYGTDTIAISGTGISSGPSPEDYVITARRNDIPRSWKCAAISDDGQKLIAGDNQIHGSTDGGVTWFTNAFYTFRDVEMTSTGLIALAGTDGFNLLIANNWGNTGTAWNLKDSARNWYGVALSEDGTKMVACVQSGQLYVSTDSGNTWTPKDSSRPWSGVACSDDGTKMFAVDNLFGRIYVSTDTGNNWTPKGSNASWSKIGCSADGTILYAAKSNGIEVSTDSGNTWTPTSASSLSYVDISCSADGSIVMAVVGGGQAYMSTDSGLNWTGIGSSLVWRSVNCSADGTKLVACADGNYIYTFVAP